MKNMDRKHCVLFYSKFSPASKNMIEYIESLPYDLPRITGMTMLSVDSTPIRNIVHKHGLDVVPCLFIQYFDGETQLLTDKLINDWIDEVSQVVSPSSPPSSSKSDSTSTLKLPSPPPPPPAVEPQTALVDKKLDVMSMAMSMQKSREAADSSLERKKHI